MPCRGFLIWNIRGILMHRMILTQRELERIVNSELADPFIFLGMHKVDDKRIVVRVFNPEAIDVSKESNLLFVNVLKVLYSVNVKYLASKFIFIPEPVKFNIPFVNDKSNCTLPFTSGVNSFIFLRS